MAQYIKCPSMVKRTAIKYFRQNHSSEEVKDLWNRTEELYKSMVAEAPDLGGKENEMSSNLYLAIGVFAFYEATGRSITADEIERLITESIPKKIPVVSAILDFNKPCNQAKMLKKFERYKELSDRKLDNGEWGNNWRVEINPHNRTKGVAFDLVGCPLADFAKKHGYEDILPLMCKFDYVTAGLIHAKLIREHTISEGDAYCDYWYIGDKDTEA